MKKYLAIILTTLLVAACFVGCGSEKSAKYDADQIRAVFANTENQEAEAEAAVSEIETPSTVYLNSTRSGAVTKAANPVVGINFDVLDNNYDIVKTNSNFQIDPIYGGGAPFYVMFDSPDEVVIGDFEYGFATALSTKWEDLLHIYDLENEVVYKVVTPLDTNRIKKIDDGKFAIQCDSAADGYRTYSFSTSEKYAYDLYMNDDDVVMIVDGGHEYDLAKELAQEAEGATTSPDENTNTTESTEEETADAASAQEDDVSSKLRIIGADEETADDPAAEETAEENTAGETSSFAETTDDSQVTPADPDTAAADLSEETAESADAAAVEEDPEEEEIETTVVQMANDAAEVELSEDQIYVAEEPEEVSTHTDIPGGRIINAPVIPQFPYYPTGCESVSTVMSLQYHGEDISVDDFINKYLDKDTGFYIKDGLKFGPSPFEYFIGNPYDNSGFGCMAPVIYNALLKIYDNNRAKVVNATGLSLDDLCLDYLNHDLPVMVWTNISMTEAFDSNTWHLEDGTEYTWQANEHCMLLVGYDQNNYYYNDPYSGAVVSFGKEISKKCYEQQGMQAIVILE